MAVFDEMRRVETAPGQRLAAAVSAGRADLIAAEAPDRIAIAADVERPSALPASVIATGSGLGYPSGRPSVSFAGRVVPSAGSHAPCDSACADAHVRGRACASPAAEPAKRRLARSRTRASAPAHRRAKKPSTRLRRAGITAQAPP